MTPILRIRSLPLAIVITLAATLAFVPGGGCATGRGQAAPDVTGGRTLEMFVEREGRRFERYRVERDGTLRFGGGQDAQDEEFSWSGPLTEAEITRLIAIIEEHRWLEVDPPSTAEPVGRSYTINVRGPTARRRFTVLGAPDDVAEVHRLLDEAARRRLDGFLQSLPQPGEPR